jgi:hypothetical protein
MRMRMLTGDGISGAEGLTMITSTLLHSTLRNNGANCWCGIIIQPYGRQMNAEIVNLVSILPHRGFHAF